MPFCNSDKSPKIAKVEIMQYGACEINDLSVLAILKITKIHIATIIIVIMRMLQVAIFSFCIVFIAVFYPNWI